MSRGDEREEEDSSSVTTMTTANANDQVKLDFDKVLGQVGEFGKYQKFFFLLLCLPALFCASTTMLSTFTVAVPKSRCEVPVCDNSSVPVYQDAFGHDGFANFTIPQTVSKVGKLEYSRCLVHPLKSSAAESDRCVKASFDQSVNANCSSYVYDQTFYTDSIVTEWNLVCDKAKQVPLATSVFFFGTLPAAPFFGFVVDRLGRRVTLMVALLLWVIAGIAWSFSVNFEMYAALEFFVSSLQIGVFQTAFILGVELVGKRYRVFCSIAIEYFFVFGEVYLVFFAYILRQWRPLILVSICPVALFLLYWPVLPESIRWLIATNKHQRALEEVKRLVKWNKGRHLAEEFDPRDFVKSEEEQNEGQNGEPCNSQQQNQESMWAFFKEKRLVIRLLNVSYCWTVVTMVYYGLSLNAASLVPGDPYVNFMIVALVEIPGYSLSYYTMGKLGRKWSTAVTLTVGGAACIADGLIDQFVSEPIVWLNVTIFMIGKLGVTAAFGTIYLYTSELLPTPVRTAALGLSSMCGRLGAIAAPYIASLQISLGSSSVPLAIFGVNAFISGTLILFLPETLGKPLPENVADALNLSNASVVVNAEHSGHDVTNGGGGVIANDDVDDDFEATVVADGAYVDEDDRGPLISNSDILD